jgi:putative transcriptional regulator
MRIYAKPDVFVRTRILQGYSQRELARLTGLSHGYISLIEKSNKSVSPAAAKKLSEVLQKNVEELFHIE